MIVKILRATVVGVGKAAKVGDIVDVTDRVAAELIGYGQAEKHTPKAEAAPKDEPAKPEASAGDKSKK